MRQTRLIFFALLSVFILALSVLAVESNAPKASATGQTPVDSAPAFRAIALSEAQDARVQYWKDVHAQEAAEQARQEAKRAEKEARAERRRIAAQAAARATRHTQPSVSTSAATGDLPAIELATRPPNAAIELCIIQHENGGDYGRSSNPTHFGRYQFSRSTWIRYGGDPNTWGHASPEEQDRVFRRAVNENGYQDWTPYNPC